MESLYSLTMPLTTSAVLVNPINWIELPNDLVKENARLRGEITKLEWLVAALRVKPDVQ